MKAVMSMMTLMHILAIKESLSTGKMSKFRNPFFCLVTLTVVVVVDDGAPPGLVIVHINALAGHLESLLDLTVIAAVDLEGAEDNLRYGQELQ